MQLFLTDESTLKEEIYTLYEMFKSSSVLNMLNYTDILPAR